MRHTNRTLDNTSARHLWLNLQDMLTSAQGTATCNSAIDTVRKLGMVQLDSINAVVRAHHHILWSRNSSYREPDYNAMLGHKPVVFEHFSHDAAILPMETYPYWQRQHKRRANAFSKGMWGKQLANRKTQRQILTHIEQNGPLCSRDFASMFTQKADKSLHPWMRPPHKLALDYLWLKGELCVSHRQGFIKHYELTERAIPNSFRTQTIPAKEQIDFLCRSAIERLGFATASEIQKFYGACELAEVRQWLRQQSAAIVNVEVESHDGTPVQMFAHENTVSMIEKLPEPSRQLRIVSPFDPVLRDRKRLKMLFGMDYRIEIFTPAAKRKYGYYVYPVMEADKITARIDVRANRQNNSLDVNAWWLERGIKPGLGRTQRLRAELKRLARLANLTKVSDIPPPSPHP